MIAAVIRWSARNVFLVVLATIFVTLAGVYAVSRVPLDAIPDLSDVQVIVYTEYPGQAPQVVEDQVTYPLTTAMLSVPKSRVVRGFSFFGVSFVYVIFEDGTDLYWARSRVLEYLSSAAPSPAGRCRAQPRSRCDRRRVGLPVRRPWRPEEPRRAAHHSGLVRPLRHRQGGGRGRGRERRRLRQAIQRRDRSPPAAGARHSAVEDPRRLAHQQHGCRRANGRARRNGIRGARARLHQEPGRHRADRRQERPRRPGPDQGRGARGAHSRRAARHHRDERRGRGRFGHRAPAVRRKRAHRHQERQDASCGNRTEPAAGGHDRAGL